jgi:hypothetical protein
LFPLEFEDTERRIRKWRFHEEKLTCMEEARSHALEVAQEAHAA